MIGVAEPIPQRGRRNRSPRYSERSERLFRTINQGLIHKLAGAVRYNVYVMRQVGLNPTKDFGYLRLAIEPLLAGLTETVQAKAARRGGRYVAARPFPPSTDQ